jgi:hypothetical protein
VKVTLSVEGIGGKISFVETEGPTYEAEKARAENQSPEDHNPYGIVDRVNPYSAGLDSGCGTVR